MCAPRPLPHYRSLLTLGLLVVAASQTGWGAPPGVVDTTFDTDGKKTVDFLQDDRAQAVVVQPDGKIVVVGSDTLHFSVARLNPNGALDTIFATAAVPGILQVDFGGYDFAQAVALQPDGKIVIAGYTGPAVGGAGPNDFAIARVHSNGTIDTTFSGNGRQTVDFGADDRALGVAIQADGKIVVAGFTDNGSPDFAVARLNTNGSPDATFGGGDGNFDFSFGGDDFGQAVAIDEAGRILIAGYTNTGGGGGINNFAIARVNANGTLDMTFDGDGLRRVDFGFDDRGTGVAIQTDGRIVVGGFAALDFAIVRLNVNGTLDANFSSDGVHTVNLGLADRSTGLVLLHNGKIAMGGWTSAGVGVGNFAFVLLNSDGTADNTFDADGELIVDFGGTDQTGGIAVQPDGQLILAGWADVGGGGGATNFAILRVGADPPLDLTFDDDGRQNTNFGNDDEGRAVLVQPDGKIVVAGFENFATDDFAIARHNIDGTVDSSFSGDGRLNINFGGVDRAHAIGRQADGKLVVAGFTDQGPGSGPYNFAVARLNTDGTLDTTFDGDGTLTIDFGNDDRANGVTIQPDGRIVVVGSDSVDFAVARLNPDGSLDTSFSTDGKVVVDWPAASYEFAHAVALQTDGKIVVAGYTGPTPGGVGPNTFAIARLTPAGILDVTFDTDGRQTTSFGLGADDERIQGLAIQPDGRIVAAGSWDAGLADFAIVRYNTNGSLDATFSGDGRQSFTFGRPPSGGLEFARGVALQPNGKIVVAGYSDAGTAPALGPNDFAVARLNADGSLDTSFNDAGKLLIDFGNDDRAYGVAVVPATGAIVAAGFTSRDQNFAVMRLPGDAAPPLPSLTLNDVAVAEGNAGSILANFTVTLSAAVPFPVTVDVATANGSAVAPADYLAVPTIGILFLPGTTAQTVSIAVNGDTLDEPIEGYTVNLSNPGNATVADAQGLGTITDEDLTVTITSPTSDPATPASVSFLAVGGTALDAGGIATVTWVNDWGGAGTAAGTTNWSIPEVPLAPGVNVITVEARDLVGNATTDTLTVTVASLAYYLAEGATGAFFDYDLVLANPTGVAAPVSTTFLRDDGVTVVDARVLPPTSRTTIRVDDIPGLGSTAVSAVVTSTDVIPIIVERSMYWDGTYYGGHAGSSVPAPATTWLFGEGSQGFFDTYVLLANANAAPANVTVTFLLEFGAPVVRNYTVAATSRFNVFAGGIPELIDKSFSIVVTSDDPDHRRARDVFRVAAVQRGARIGGGECGVDGVVPRRGGDGAVFRHVHSGGEPEPGARDGDVHVPAVERGGDHAGEGDCGEHAADGERGVRGSAAGGCGGVDDGDVGSAGDLGAGDVLARTVYDLVRGTQQLRGDADGDEVGVGGGAVRGAVQLPDLHSARESEPDDGGDRADYVPEDRRDDAGEELRGQSDVTVQRGRQRDGAGAGRGAVWRAH